MQHATEGLGVATGAGAGPWMRHRWRGLGVVGGWALAGVAAVLPGSPTCPVAALLHLPCPGCGTTRALRLLLAGHPGASVGMAPLAAPALVVGAMIVLSTVHTTLATGSPALFYQTRGGRFALAAAALILTGMVAVWALRWWGWFGGPVPV